MLSKHVGSKMENETLWKTTTRGVYLNCTLLKDDCSDPSMTRELQHSHKTQAVIQNQKSLVTS